MAIEKDLGSKENPTETSSSAVNSSLNEKAKTAGMMTRKMLIKVKDLGDYAIRTVTSDAATQRLNETVQTSREMTSEVLAKARHLADNKIKATTSDPTKKP